MKRNLLTLAVLLAWTGTVHAGEIVVKVPADEYRQTQKQLEALQKQVERLEQEVKAGKRGEEQQQTTVAAPASSSMKKLEKSVSDIYDTLDEVETKSLLDRINLGAEVRVRMDNYQVKDFDQWGMSMYYSPALDVDASSTLYVDNPGMPGYGWVTHPSATDERNDGNWSSRFRLLLDSEVSKTVSFHGRLSLFKNWADSMPGYSDDTMRSQRASGDTDLKVDRFYIDWIPKFVVPIAFTIGRQPTTDGPPYEFKEDRLRQSTYPALLFDGEPDGAVVTLGLERYTGLKNSGLRYFYAMAFQYDNDTQSYLDGIYQDQYKDVEVNALFFEAELPKLRDSLLVMSYIDAKNFFAADPEPMAMGGSGSMANIGDMAIWGAHLQLRDLFGSGIDGFVSYGESRSEPNGQSVSMGGASGLGLLSDGSEKHTGRAYYVGMRYELPMRFLNLPKIGIEYNKGTQYWFSFTPGSAEVYNKLATRGQALDLYYIQPMNKNIMMRTGYTQIEYDYTGSGSYLGAPVDFDAQFGKKPKFNNFYILLDCRF